MTAKPETVQTVLRRLLRVVERLPLDGDETQALDRLRAAILALELVTGRDVVAQDELLVAATDAYRLRRSSQAFLEAQRRLEAERDAD